MDQILDQKSDVNGQFLNRIMSSVDASGRHLFSEPDFVKSASKEELVGQEDLQPGVYGNPARREFPCHTPGATWLSALCFHAQKEAYSREWRDLVENRIDKAARFHGISGKIQEVKKAAAEYLQGASEEKDSDFAIVIEGENGVKQRGMPLRNANEVKAACAYLKTYRERFTYEDRCKIAEAILRKAAEFRTDIPDREGLEKQAGQGTCSAETAARFLFSRAETLHLLKRNPEYQESLTKMAMQLLKNPAFAHLPSNLRKIASFVDRIDRHLGLDKLSLPKAEDHLFIITIKAAQDLKDSHISMTSGKIYSKQALASLSLNEIRSVMGDEFVAAVTSNGFHVDGEKLAAVALTLPRPDAELFDRLMAANGIKPVFKEAAHQRQGLSREEMRGLAAAHVADVRAA